MHAQLIPLHLVRVASRRDQSSSKDAGAAAVFRDLRFASPTRIKSDRRVSAMSAIADHYFHQASSAVRAAIRSPLQGPGSAIP